MAAATALAPATMEQNPVLSPEPRETIEQSVAKPANALTPPTSEEMNHDEKKKEHEDSELSELDLDDDDDLEDIEPDHYWEARFRSSSRPWTSFGVLRSLWKRSTSMG